MHFLRNGECGHPESVAPPRVKEETPSEGIITGILGVTEAEARRELSRTMDQSGGLNLRVEDPDPVYGDIASKEGEAQDTRWKVGIDNLWAAGGLQWMEVTCVRWRQFHPKKMEKKKKRGRI